MSKTIWLDGETLDALDRRGIHVDRATGKVLQPTQKAVAPKPPESRTTTMTSSINAIAEPVAEADGKRWKLDGKLLTDDELQAEMQRRHDRQSEYDQLDRELGLMTPIQGVAQHKAAVALLASRGKHKPSQDEYLEALVEVTP